MTPSSNNFDKYTDNFDQNYNSTNAIYDTNNDNNSGNFDNGTDGTNSTYNTTNNSTEQY